MDDRVLVEIKNDEGKVVNSYYITRQQMAIAQKLSFVREQIGKGEMFNAVNLLAEVCQQSNINFFQVMDNAKLNFQQEQEKKLFEEQINKLEEMNLTDVEMEEEEEGDYQSDGHQSILEEQGKVRKLKEAFNQNDSFLCNHCMGLITQRRKEAHLNKWCPALYQ